MLPAMYLDFPDFPTTSPFSITTFPRTIVMIGIPSSSIPLKVEKSLLPCSSSTVCFLAGSHMTISASDPVLIVPFWG